MTIGLTLPDEMLENASHTVTALEIWQEICNVHKRHTLLNKLAARRDFYTATMKEKEQMLVYTNRIRQIASVLQSMDVVMDDKEMAMAALNGLPPRYGTIIAALDAIGDDDPSFTLDKVRSRLLQEENRSTLRKVSENNAATSVLVNQAHSSDTRPVQKKCTHCGRNNHTEPYCWKNMDVPYAQEEDIKRMRKRRNSYCSHCCSRGNSRHKC